MIGFITIIEQNYEINVVTVAYCRILTFIVVVSGRGSSCIIGSRRIPGEEPIDYTFLYRLIR
jgi:hypothetical protein